MAVEIPLPADEMFGSAPWPDWVRGFRPHQWDATLQATEAFDAGIKLVLLDAGTGAGKSLIAEMIRRYNNWRSVLSCTTKSLQDQYVHDFPHAAVVKGRSNYWTESGKLDAWGKPAPRYQKWSDITCADCTYNAESGCRWCGLRNLCPYVVAKTKAELADLAVVNTSLFITDSNLGRGAFTGRDLVVLDEADKLEDELLGHVEINISEARRERMGLLAPRRKTVEKTWPAWVQGEAIPCVTDYLAGLKRPNDPGTYIGGPASSKEIKEYKSTVTLLDNLRLLEQELQAGGWVYDGYDRGDVIFRPVRVSSYGHLLWSHGRRFLLMTATPISPELMLEEIGWEEEYEVVTIPNMFPIENRPVYPIPVADMSYKAKVNSGGGTWDEMVEGVRAVLNKHPNERILVHTVSYELARHIKDGLKLNPSPPTDQSNRPIITYTESRGKEDALRDYKSYPNSVLIASSMDRGVDLPGDLCTVQVIAKIPFPNMKDKRINARMFSVGGTAWYRIQAIRSLIQMCGRGMRSKDDTCVTYVLDEQFKTNLWKSDHLFPKWFTDAISFRMNKRQLGLK